MQIVTSVGAYQWLYTLYVAAGEAYKKCKIPVENYEYDKRAAVESVVYLKNYVFFFIFGIFWLSKLII